VKSGTPLDFGKLLGCVSHVYQPIIVTPLFIRVRVVRVVRVEISKCFILPSRKKVSITYLHPPKTNMTIEKQPFEDLKMYLLSNTLIACCHASFQGCSHCNKSKTNQVNIDPADESMNLFAPV